jgi:hypothetical protein
MSGSRKPRPENVEGHANVEPQTKTKERLRIRVVPSDMEQRMRQICICRMRSPVDRPNQLVFPTAVSDRTALPRP